jgi:hypothetical protein
MNENTIAAKAVPMSARAKGPVKTIRDDSDKAIAASIWEREGQEGAVYYTYTLSRSFKSKSSGKEGYSGDFYGRNAKALANVAQQAETWIVQRQSISDNQPPS